MGGRDQYIFYFLLSYLFLLSLNLSLHLCLPDLAGNSVLPRKVRENVGERRQIATKTEFSKVHVNIANMSLCTEAILCAFFC